MKLSRTTLEFCDWLLDGVTISSQAPDLLTEAKKVSDARDEVDAALNVSDDEVRKNLEAHGMDGDSISAEGPNMSLEDGNLIFDGEGEAE